MFLLVSGRHVGAHPDGHQHGVSIQISINLGKRFLRISCIRKIAVTSTLARVFAYLLSFFSQILDLINWTVLIFILICFEWRDTENQQLIPYVVIYTFVFNRPKVSQLVTLHVDSKPISVLCHMGDFGCGDGGWTPVMKIDGNKVRHLSTGVIFFHRNF